MLRIALQIATFLILTLPGLADDWVANRLRGTAEHMVHGQWIALVRGASVLDGQKVRTGADGRVEMVRGAEVIELDPGTQIELHEGQGNTTSIEMTGGMITADVERRNVQHFSVQTPYLAAVVKGTRFSVAVGDGAARVEVDRGTVQVQDTANDLVVDIVRGQAALVSEGTPLEVSGPGTAAVFTFEGQRVVNGTSDVPADEQGKPVDADNGNPSGIGNGNSGNTNAGGNGNGNAGNTNAGGNGNGNAGNSNAGGNGNGNAGNTNAGGNSNGNAGNTNAGGNGNGNAGNSNAGGNGNGNSGNSNAGGNGNGNSGNSNAGGNGNGNSGNSNTGGNGNGNSGNSNAGGNGNGNGNGRGNSKE